MGSQRDGGIAWCDETWNPIRGCSRVSAGCVNCYAEAVAARFSDPGMAYEGLARRTPSGPRWTGVVRLIEEHLTDPVRWKRRRKVFVNSMSDLFHEKVPDEWILRILDVIERSPQHIFQVLTKRPERMRDVFLGTSGAGASAPTLPNLWLGVSCENQETADERIPILLQAPAAVRFISAEPLLGPIDLSSPVLQADCDGCLDWVIVGGESGPGARPCDIIWIRSTVQQCQDAGVPVFVKQLGSNVIDRNDSGFEGDPGDSWTPYTRYEPLTSAGWQGDPVRIRLRDRKGGAIEEWPEDLRVREFPKP